MDADEPAKSPNVIGSPCALFVLGAALLSGRFLRACGFFSSSSFEGVAATFDAAAPPPAIGFFGSAAFVPPAAFAHEAAPPAIPTRPAQHGTKLDPLHHIYAVASTQTTAPPMSISASVLILSVLEYRSTRVVAVSQSCMLAASNILTENSQIYQWPYTKWQHGGGPCGGPSVRFFGLACPSLAEPSRLPLGIQVTTVLYYITGSCRHVMGE